MQNRIGLPNRKFNFFINFGIYSQVKLFNGSTQAYGKYFWGIWCGPSVAPGIEFISGRFSYIILFPLRASFLTDPALKGDYPIYDIKCSIEFRFGILFGPE